MHAKSAAMAALVLGSAVILGAFGAHFLSSRSGPDILATWQTGVLYQFIHGLALLFLSLVPKDLTMRQLRYARHCFLAGVLLFSGSLYMICLAPLISMAGLTRFMGPATPIGGLFYIIGWTVLFISFVQAANARQGAMD